MNLEMIPIQIVGLKSDLKMVAEVIRRIGCMHIEEIAETAEISARPLMMDRETLHYQEQLSFLAARIGGLLDALGIDSGNARTLPDKEYIDKARACVESLMPMIQSLVSQKERLQSELASLPRYEITLRKLLPIIPPSARYPGNVTVVVLVSRLHIEVLDTIANQVLELTSGRAEVIASDVDATTRAMLVVFPSSLTSKIESLLGREDVTRLRLPAELGEGPPDITLEKLQHRMKSIPGEIRNIDDQLASLAIEWQGNLINWSAWLKDEIEANRVLSRFGETDMTFVIAGWVPKEKFSEVNAVLKEAIGEAFLIGEIPLTPEMKKRAPVCLKNPALAKPFESLVNLLALPRYGHIDPTRLMALFLPIFFGMILGDVGYGVLLLLITFFLRSKFRKGVGHDVLTVLTIGAAWSIVFGFLYGEAFGSIGEKWGMHPLLLDRASSEDIAGLLGMSLVVGAVHITIGLILGVWEAIKDNSRSHLLERGGMLIGLVGLFLMIGGVTKFLPTGFMTPAIAGVIIGIVLMGASLGWLGILMGPIEFIGLIGNILSYLRIAAIGLASVYLAKVANDVAGMAGNFIVGLIIALLIHSLNLVLGAFSPTIHSLRLHYVEFFRKFYEGGGRSYEPYRSQLKMDNPM